MRLHRLIAILLLLESRGCIKAKDLAEALETSKRTIHRDIDLLCESGVPITSLAGPLGGYSLVPGYALNFKSLYGDELINLYLSGIGLHPNEYSQASLALKNAILKIEKMVPTDYVADIKKVKERFYFDPDSWADDRPDLRYLDILRYAVLHLKKMRVTYNNSSMGKQETMSRVIRPYGLVVKNAEWYLVAFCESKNDMRVFKCIRILEVEVLDETYSIPSDFQLDAFWECSKVNFKRILSQAPLYPVTLKLLSISKDELSGMDIIEEDVGGINAAITVNLYTYSNACKRCIEYGNGIEVLTPEELKEFIINNARELLRIYQK
jgi:predicted DNA-binding transcriptional regulator YafY